MNMAKGNRRKKRIPGPAKSEKRENREKETLRRSAISVFILFHLIAITCWALPLDFSALRSVRELIQPYMAWSGPVSKNGICSQPIPRRLIPMSKRS